jgi:glycosyltransferase involved in cell wall biosynthesis
MRRQRILVLGEVLLPSGYATVLQNLLSCLAERCELHVFARSYTGPARNAAWTVHPNTIAGDIWGIEQVPALLDRLRPDLVWVIYDAVLYLVHREALAGWPTVLYCPIDGAHPEPETIARLAPLARLVLFTEAARAAVVATGCALPPMAVIPHGVDVDTFKPLGDRRALRREMLGRDDGFVVLNANRNNRRKRPDVTVAGFAQLARARQDAFLCLHMDATDEYDLRAQAHAAGIEQRVIWSDRELTPAALNRLYNACDVGVNTSSGEGWGLVAFEHAATGAPQIVPRHSACAELWHEAGVFLEPVATCRAPLALCEGREVSADALGESLVHLHDDPAYRGERGRGAYQTATAPRYRWPAIAESWLELFAEVAGRRWGGGGQRPASSGSGT